MARPDVLSLLNVGFGPGDQAALFIDGQETWAESQVATLNPETLCLASQHDLSFAQAISLATIYTV